MSVEIRIRIGRIVSDRPLGAHREAFAETLAAEVGALLRGRDRPADARVPANGNVSSGIARAIAARVPPVGLTTMKGPTP